MYKKMLKKAIKNADRHYEDACNLPYETVDESKIQWTELKEKDLKRIEEEKKIIETINQIQKKYIHTVQQQNTNI
ncbi:301L [Invertebrate iridescent virus Kaz2018]|uniref:Uncharacterized protein 301L n=1 Tax=Invertebrate iridescent virus 6 TaxID=176652 RepID=301L_IIV6|nr:301L [Invertebrate iridescent virus 6]Q91FM3.1 RecName: Full=Uncharacterized protein 301L [Invertebrate iridescent virus 6]AAK82162.1 301L [Invertebrate iridescent virus 6]QMS79592.1 hypothetical protein IIV6-T1_295 [Invertebrate iridescent virus 6]QNH08710.1 301L [Invertebrate iridescent virus Kaz2018]